MPVFCCPKKQHKASSIINPLKWLVKIWIFKDYRAKAQEAFTDNSVKKIMGLTFRFFNGLHSRFWFVNVALRLRSGQVYLSRETERVNAMESQNWGWCPIYFREALFPKYSFSRSVGKCTERLIKLVFNKTLILLF